MFAKVDEIDAIFSAAIELLTAAQRTEYVQAACGDNAALRLRVDELLKAHFSAGDFLEQPPTAFLSTDGDALSEGPGTVIGPYKLLQQIGEGGFGVVYLAEQERPVRRRVALKVIKPGMDTREVISRFEAERQALAMMDHPGIAKVFDAGTTGEDRGQESGGSSQAAASTLTPDSRLLTPTLGRPYFVMELVQGVPITEYCDECNLSTRERLELFVAVCQAVQHAHQKGIIHRDLKPTNVLVAMQDGNATPKIIDFGVAKAIGQRLTEHTLTTAFAQMVGTPLYMSPEQAELSPLGVDTRSDIYSLGVLLYELLTGATPFDKERLHQAPYDELRRIIREEEPPRPSVRISTLAADLATTIADRRRTDVRRLNHQVRGELDWIVMKCLEKDRSRRYDSAAAFAADVQRYLHDEPVQACPPSTNYRFRKFARRNKFLLGAGGAIAAALLIGLGLAMWMYVLATTESARAKAVAGLLQEAMGSADAGQLKGADYKVREQLADFSTALGDQLADQPLVEAEVRETIGRAYRSLRLPDRAQPHFEKAIELRRQHNGPRSEQLAALLVDYGWNLHDQERNVEADSQLQEALAIYHQRGVTGEPFIHVLHILQHVLISLGRDADAERVTQQALAVARRNGVEYPDLAGLLHRYADLKNKQGRYAEGEQLARQAVAMHRRLQGDQAWALRSLARSLQWQGKLQDAENALRDGLAIFRHNFPPDHPDVRDVMSEIRSVLESRGDAAALESFAKEEAAAELQVGGPDNRVRLAGILLSGNPAEAGRKEREDEARLQIRQALDEYDTLAANAPGNFHLRMKATDGYTRALLHIGGVPSCASEVEDLNRRLGDELPKMLAAFPDSRQSRWEIAMCYLSWGRLLSRYGIHHATAEHALSKSAEALEGLSLFDASRPYLWIWLASSYANLGEVQWRVGKLQEAEGSLRRAQAIQDEHAAKIEADTAADPYDGNVEMTGEFLRLASFLAATKHEEQAGAAIQRATASLKRLTDPIDVANFYYLLALAQAQRGDEAGYQEACRALVEAPSANFDDWTRYVSIWALCLAPHALDDQPLPVKRAEDFAARNALSQRHFALQALGAMLYRAGQYDRAAVQLNESLAAYPSAPQRGFDTINYTRLLLAMTCWQQGQRDEARQWLANAKRAVDDELKNHAIAYHRRVTLELLRREAESLIRQIPSDDAPQDESPTVKAPAT